MTRTLCTLLVVLACVSTLPACGKVTSYMPTAPSEPTPTSEPATTVAGRVFNTLNDNSIADVAVEVVGTELKTTTDGEGRYRIEGIRTTAFTVKYSHPDYPSVERNRTVQLGTQLLDLNVGLTPATPQITTSISGTVYGGTQSAAVLVPNATVEVVSPEADKGLKTTTNSRGFYKLSGIKSSSFVVRYSHPSYKTEEKTYNSQVGKEWTDINVLLARK